MTFSKDKILHSTQGFTLLEILISISLLSAIMLGVYSLIDNSARTKEKVLATDKESLQMELALGRFALDFSQIYSPLYFSAKYNPESAQVSLDKNVIEARKTNSFPQLTTRALQVPLTEVDQSSFTFFTSSNRRKIQDEKQSNYAWVRYALKSPTQQPLDNKEAKGKDFIRYFMAHDPYQEEVNWEEVKGFTLAKNIKSLNFTFWDDLKESFVEFSPNMIIRAVKIKLTWIDYRGFENHIERVYRPLWPYFNAEEEEKELIDLFNRASLKSNQKAESNKADDDDSF